MISLKDLTDLKKGDYITHFDYGIGRFDGLRIKNTNGKYMKITYSKKY